MVLLLICIVKHPQDQLLTRALNTQEIAIRISANKGYISDLSLWIQSIRDSLILVAASKAEVLQMPSAIENRSV